MARTTSTKTVLKKTVPKKKRVVRTKKQPTRFDSKKTIGRIAYLIGLMLLLAFSVGMVGYVVFFRTVIAAELPFEEKEILFEEPWQTDHSHTLVTVPAETSHNVPAVAIIIDDMGYHHRVGQALINLSLDLSFSFLPYAPFTAELEEMAYQHGKTILLHLPMEPQSSDWDPGPDALYLKDSSSVHQILLNKNLRFVPHATGVNSHMGSKFSADSEAMDALAGMLSHKQLFFIDSFTTSSSKGLASARKRGVLSARRDVFLDNVQKEELICKQLEKLVTLAKHRGGAIGIGHPYPETFNALKTCGPSLLSSVELKGVEKMVQ